MALGVQKERIATGIAMNRNELKKCPVCDMVVAGRDHEVTYQNMPFVFCSDQCKARFLAHPRLYIGFPGSAAPKHEGRVSLRRRHLRLEQPLSVEGKAILEGALCDVMGIDAVNVVGDRIDITYDLLEVSLEELEAILAGIGARLGGNWGETLRRAWIHESEETELGSLEATPVHRYHP